MSKRHPYIGPSEAQSEALARRVAPFAQETRTSAGVAFDYRRRQTPRDLNHATYLVRKAYQDEVPTKLHESGLADDGTPAMTSRAEAYIFGSPTWTDAGKGEEPIMAFYATPFRARLDEMEHHPAESVRKHAAIVKHVTIGGQEAEHAAQSEGVPSWCSRDVAMTALTRFLNGLSDVKVDVARGLAAA